VATFGFRDGKVALVATVTDVEGLRAGTTCRDAESMCRISGTTRTELTVCESAAGAIAQQHKTKKLMNLESMDQRLLGSTQTSGAD